MQVDIKAPHLILRRLQSTDAAALADLAGDKKIAATKLHIPHPFSTEDANAMIQHAHQGFSEGTSYHYGMVADAKLVGVAALRLTPGELGTADVMYWLGVPYWGRGYATKAAQALIYYGFGQLNLQCITAKHALFNPASAKVMKKCGATHRGIKVKAVYKDGAWHDSSNWSILAQEYGRVQPAKANA